MAHQDNAFVLLHLLSLYVRGVVLIAALRIVKLKDLIGVLNLYLPIHLLLKPWRRQGFVVLVHLIHNALHILYLIIEVVGCLDNANDSVVLLVVARIFEEDYDIVPQV